MGDVGDVGDVINDYCASLTLTKPKSAVCLVLNDVMLGLDEIFISHCGGRCST